jgi:hypothetical protein
MAISLTQAQTQLDAWLAADTAVASRQSYTVNGRSVTRADAAEITQKIEYWAAKVDALSGTRRRGVARVTPL